MAESKKRCASDDIEDLNPSKRSTSEPQTYEPVVSMSRRTDVMARWDRYLGMLREGSTVWNNPFRPTQKRLVNLRPYERKTFEQGVMCLAIWTKNIGPFLETWNNGSDGDKNLLASYPAIILNMTLNSPVKELEPGLLPPFELRLRQMIEFANIFGPQSVIWRFDPIVHYRRLEGFQMPKTTAEQVPDERLKPQAMTTALFGDGARDNLSHFEEMCAAVSRVGIDRVVIAFMRLDKKVPARFARYKLQAIVPDKEQRLLIAGSMVEMAAKHGVCICACSSEDLVGVNPTGDKRWAIKPFACIGGEDIQGCLDGKMGKAQNAIEALMRGSMRVTLPAKTRVKDSGQRPVCNCIRSVDIGTYMPACPHGCVYGYCNPAVY